MQVNKISNITFEADILDEKKRYVSAETKKGVQELLKKMNNSTKYTENAEGTAWTSYILASINMGKDVKFTDNRFYIYPVKKPEENVVDCTLKIGSNRLEINSTTGEIAAYKKSCFTFWCSLLKKAETCINELTSAFDNAEIVNKNILGIQGYTQKGIKRLQYFK